MHPGATLPVAPDPFVGRTMGKYEVLCRLSTGGMSQIFLASQKGLAGFRKLVVLKSILPDIRGEEEFVRMFLDEAKITAAFNHPNIAQVFDLDVDGSELFLAMEFVPGCTLVEVARACRQNNEPIPTGFTLSAVRDTALALHYAHTFTDPLGRKRPVIHRDVAEKNVMVTYEGVTKLLDFGIAKSLARASRTSVGMVKGTSGYMSPEQILGEDLDARSDVFSLGVVLHECLTGMRLFHGKNPEEGMMAALKMAVAPPSRQNREVTPELDAVVLKALARLRQERFSSALEFGRALERAAGSLIWHPEQSGQLVQRLFAERRAQTYELFQQAQMGGDSTGEFRLNMLLDQISAPATPNSRPPPPPVSLEDLGGMATPAHPLESLAAKAELLLRPQLQSERGPAIISPAMGPLPVAKPGRGSVHRRSDDDGRSITDAPTPVARGALPPPVEDDSDPEMLTIPATELPGGLFGPPEKADPDEDDRPNTAPIAPEMLEAALSGERTAVLAPDGAASLEKTTPGAEITATGVTLGRWSVPWTSVILGVGVALGVFVVGALLFGLNEESAEEVAEEPAPLRAPPVEPPPKLEAVAPEPKPPEPKKPEPVPEKAPEPSPEPPAPAQVVEPKVVAKPKPAPRPAPKRKVEKPPEESAEKAGSGLLTLVTDPYAKVLFKSQDLGVTPLFKVSMPVGRHTLKLIGPDQKALLLPVEIKDGSVTAIRISLSDLGGE